MRDDVKNRLLNLRDATGLWLRARRRAFAKTYLLIAGLLFLFAEIVILTRPNERPELLSSSDYWVHAAVLHNVTAAIESDAPLAASLAPLSYKHKRPYMLALAVTSAASGLPPATVFLLAGLVNVPLLALGIAFFARRFVSAHAPAGLFLLTALLFWGTGFFHSNEYQLSVLPVVASYPSTFCFALSLLALGVFGRLCSNQPRGRVATFGSLALIALLGAETLLDHPRTFFSFFLPTAILASLFLARDWTRKFFLLLALILPFLLAALWPWSDELYGIAFNLAKNEVKTEIIAKTPTQPEPAEPDPIPEDIADPETQEALETPTVRQGRALKTFEKHYTYKGIKRRAPAVFFGFPLVVLLLFRRNRKARLIAAGALACLGLWAFCGYVLGTALGYRWLYFYGFFMQIAAARLIWEFGVHRKWWPVSLLILAVVASIGWECARHAVKTHLAQPIAMLPYGELDRIASTTGKDRVLARPLASHYMGAFGMRPAWEGRVRQGAPPAEITRWLEDPTSETLLRAAEATGAAWFLEDKKDEPSDGSLGRTGMPKPTLETPRYALYRIEGF